MRIVVHCGQPKTGSTALQMSLWSARHVLRESGVLYPTGDARSPHTHKALAPLFMRGDRLPRHLAYRDTRRRQDVELMSAAERLWTGILREVDRSRPEVLVLSAETFCSLRTEEEADDFRRLLAQLADDVTLVLYVRNPAERYLSAVRQQAKAHGSFTAPSQLNVRSFVESATVGFGRPVELRAYDPSALVGGDVVADFLAAEVGGSISPRIVQSFRSNESISTEAAVLLLSFRRNAMPETVGYTVRESRVLRRIVQVVDNEIPRAMPDALQAHVYGDLIRSSTELDWLRDRCGFSLRGIDYPVSDERSAPDLARYTRIEDVCVVDYGRLEVLTARTLEALVVGNLRPGAVQWFGLADNLVPYLPRRTQTWLKRRLRLELR